MQIKVTIKNWEKYQLRTDIKKHSWLRLENQFFYHHKTSSMTAEQVRMYIFCLCEASREMGAQFDTSFTHISKTLGLTAHDAESILSQIADLGVLRYVPVTATNVDDRTRTLPYSTLHNITVPKICASDDAPAYEQLLEIWNQNRGTLPEARGFNKARRRVAQLSWREHSNPEEWVTVAKKLAASSFCNGANDRSWRAGFDYFIRPTVFLKVMEGFYDKAPSQGAGIVFKKRLKNESSET